jgi:DNA-binding response OmpR family regulator
MARILLVDDDPNVLDMLALTLQDEGHEVETATDGNAGLRAAERGRADLVISDVNMPGLDGFTLCHRLRSGGFVAPIVLLTARDGDIDEALGLELGADDYVVKPFSARVLLLRVAALLRREQLRAAGPSHDLPVVRVGPLLLVPERMEATWSGQPFTTTLTEFRLLVALASRPGTVHSRDQLLERIRGDVHVDGRLIDTYVRRIRKKLRELEPDFDAIDTVPGVGYRWRAEP